MKDNDLLLVILSFALGAVVGANWSTIRENAFKFVEAVKATGGMTIPDNLIVYESPKEGKV
jgi:hypothetical protein